MNTLLTLRDFDIFPNEAMPLVLEWKDRRTAVVVLLDADERIALVGNTVNEFLLLPGGGIDENEDQREGAHRECLEETGCRMVITSELGVTDDYRTRDSRHSINYGFLGSMISKEDQQLTESEKDIGLYIRWAKMDEALELFKTQKLAVREGNVRFYNTAFNIMRDAFFIEKVSKLPIIS